MFMERSSRKYWLDTRFHHEVRGRYLTDADGRSAHIFRKYIVPLSRWRNHRPSLVTSLYLLGRNTFWAQDQQPQAIGRLRRGAYLHCESSRWT